jgi:hypothetical protein
VSLWKGTKKVEKVEKVEPQPAASTPLKDANMTVVDYICSAIGMVFAVLMSSILCWLLVIGAVRELSTDLHNELMQRRALRCGDNGGAPSGGCKFVLR